MMKRLRERVYRKITDLCQDQSCYIMTLQPLAQTLMLSSSKPKRLLQFLKYLPTHLIWPYYFLFDHFHFLKWNNICKGSIFRFWITVNNTSAVRAYKESISWELRSLGKRMKKWLKSKVEYFERYNVYYVILYLSFIKRIYSN